MAKILCIKSKFVNKIKADLKSGKISLVDLYNMNSSEERQAVWEPYGGKDVAKFINTNFEAAMVSDSKTAVDRFVKSVTTVKEEGSKKNKDLLAKIGELDADAILNADSRESTFTDLVSDRLGVSVTADEIKDIVTKAKEIEVLKTDLASAESKADKIDNAKKWRATIEPALIAYKKSLTEMDKYMNSLVPTHNLKVITGTIFRGNMLLNIPPATINTISNIVQGIMQAGERRLASRKLTGQNSDFAIEYAKMAITVFHKTGYDISRQYAEDIRLGEQIVHSEGPGIVRAAGRGISKVVFKYLLGYSDVISASIAAADSSNVASAKIAKVNGFKGEAAKKKALQIFKESVKTVPNLASPVATDAIITRTQAIADAEYATWTNKGFIADRSIGLRNWLNDATGDLQLGFWNMPFIKTGANVIQFGLESSPLGGIPAMFKFNSAWKTAKDPAATTEQKKAALDAALRSAVRAGMGSIVSVIIASLIPPDDFFSAYEVTTQKQRELLGIKKGVYNAVKIGDKWISLDFFGALGAGFVGIMYAKKYGRGFADTAFKGAQGIGAQALQVPGLQDFEGLYRSMKEVLTAETKEEAGLMGASAAINSVRARAIPGILNTLAKGMDPKVRRINNKELLSRFKAGVPGLRQKLEAKIDITTGEEVKGEGFFTNLLFGSRVKTANESALIDEISRLEREGQTPTIADIEKSSSKVQGLKQQISSDKYQDALKWFGKEYGRRTTRLLKTSKYTRSTDEEKRDLLNEIRSDVRAMMLRRFGYRKPRSKGLR